VIGRSLRRAAGLALVALAFVALGRTPDATAATTGPVFGLRAEGNPAIGYFVYDLAPGATQAGAIVVSNTGDRSGTVKLYPADATTGRTTGTVYLTDRPPAGTGTWVQLAGSSLTLAPGRSARVPFTVTVPATAKPGQWVAGIVAEQAKTAQQSSSTHRTGVRIRIRNLTIVAVQTNVPGPAIVSFTVGAVTTGGQHGFQQLIVRFTNAGNQLRKPRGTVTILDSKNTVVETLTYAMDTFLPQTSIDYPLLLSKALSPGDYRARIRLTSPGASPGSADTLVTATRSFAVSSHDVTQVFTSSKPTQAPPASATGATSGSSSTPWALIVGAAVGVLLLALLVVLLVRRRPAGPTAP
jgi:hypothetical protein